MAGRRRPGSSGSTVVRSPKPYPNTEQAGPAVACADRCVPMHPCDTEAGLVRARTCTARTHCTRLWVSTAEWAGQEPPCQAASSKGTFALVACTGYMSSCRRGGHESGLFARRARQGRWCARLGEGAGQRPAASARDHGQGRCPCAMRHAAPKKKGGGVGTLSTTRGKDKEEDPNGREEAPGLVCGVGRGGAGPGWQ